MGLPIMPIDPNDIEWEEAPSAPAGAPSSAPATQDIEWESVPQDTLGGQTAALLRGVRKSLPFGQDIGAAATYLAGGNPLVERKLSDLITGQNKPPSSFEEAKRQQIAQDVALQRQYPKTTFAGEMAGFFTPGVGVAGKMAQAEQAVASRLAPKIGETAARIAGAGAAGAGAGAVSGLGTGVTAEERLGEAGKQAIFGGVGGSLFPAVGAAVRGRPLTAAEEAAERLGIDLPGYIGSESRIQKGLATAAGSVPIGGARIPQSAEKAITQMGEVAGNLLPSVSREEAGETAKDALVNWVKNRSTRAVEKAYDAVDRYVDNSKKTALVNTANTIQSLGRKRLEATLPEESSAIKMVLDGATNPQGLNYSGIKRLRSEIGEKLKEGILPADLSRAELKNIYGALTEDLREAVKNAGSSQGLRAFERANNLYRDVSAKRKQLTKIVGLAGDVAPEAVFNRLVTMASEKAGNLGRLKQARSSMSPDQWEDVTSGILSTIGRNPEGGFSPERFITGYYKMSDAGRDAIFGPAGNPLRQSLDDLLQVSGKFKELGKFTNTSKTANVLAGISLLAEPFSAMGTAVSANIIARILSRPRTARAAATLAKTRTRQAYDAYLAAIRSEMGQSVEEPRQERASGGRIGKRDYPAKKLSSLEKAARRALGGIAKDTTHIMDMPDEEVANALRMAK